MALAACRFAAYVARAWVFDGPPVGVSRGWYRSSQLDASLTAVPPRTQGRGDALQRYLVSPAQLARRSVGTEIRVAPHAWTRRPGREEPTQSHVGLSHCATVSSRR